MIYYEKDGITVRPSTPADVEYLKDKLRASDVQEIWASDHVLPEQALRMSLERSFMCLTGVNVDPVLMFGICPSSLLGNDATIWMLSSEDLNKTPIRFLKNCRKFVDMFLDQYPVLWNYVDVRNRKSVAWLKMLGAKMSEPVEYGVDGMMFRKFIFERGA